MSEDLEEIIERAFFEAFNNGKSTKGVISKAIKDAGYCKFPVEKLKERLEAFENFENSRKKQGYPKYDSTEIFVQIKKIIKELEDGT